jgi:DNA-binding MarR family transcriptional regulator
MPLAERRAAPDPGARPQPYFARVPARACELELSKLALRVLIALGRYADRDGHCWPGQGTIARLVGARRPKVSGAIAELEAVGLLTIARGQRGCVYRLALEAGAADVPAMGTSGTLPDVPKTRILMSPPRGHKLERELNLKEAWQRWRSDVPATGTTAEYPSSAAIGAQAAWRDQADTRLERALHALVSGLRADERETFAGWARVNPAGYRIVLQDLAKYLTAPPASREEPRRQLELRLHHIIGGID